MNKKRIVYHLTPSGISQKAQLAYNFFITNYHLFSDIREIVSLRFKTHPNLKGKKIAIYGLNEVTEIVYFCIKENGIHFDGIYEDNENLIGTDWYGEPIKDYHQLKNNGKIDYLINVKNDVPGFLNLEILTPEDLLSRNKQLKEQKESLPKESSNFQLKICGDSDSVSGSSILLKTGEKNILVDCGIPGANKEDSDLKNSPFSFNPENINYLFLTHAHIERSGRIPQLIDQGFKGEIICHHDTAGILPKILKDSFELNGCLPASKGKLGKMLNPDQLLEKIITLCWSFEYNQWNQISKNLRFRFLEAGHIPGSVTTQIDIDGEYIVFSGDIENHNSAGTDELDSFQRKSARKVEAREGRNHNSAGTDELNSPQSELFKTSEAGNARVSVITRNPVVPDRADVLILEMPVNETSGLSTHTNHGGLLKWVEMIKRKPHTIYLNNGKQEAQNLLKKELQERFENIKVFSC